MGLTKMAWFRATNDLIHDISGGAWIGGAYVLWVVNNGARATLAPDVFSSLQRTWTWVVGMLFTLLAVQVVTGLIRVKYWSMPIAEEARTAKGRAALAKHAVFVTLFVAAAVVAFMALQP